ncbi:MAG: response regulator [Variovorax sp.]
MKILVAENEPLIAIMLEEALQSAGHAVIGPSASVEEALAAAKISTPELALLDINLLAGGSGIDLAHALLSLYGTPSIFVSGNPYQAREAKDAALGFISKPFRIAAVITAISVARAIIAGDVPYKIPPGFEVFPGAVAPMVAAAGVRHLHSGPRHGQCREGQ